MKQVPAVLISEASYIKIPIGLEVISIQFSEGIFDDITIHDFLVSKVLLQQPTALIIPASLGLIRTNYWGFRIAMHLRLTEALGKLRYIPLILVSDDPLEQILTAQNEKLGVLCTTPGSILVKNEDGEIAKALQINALTPSEYSTQFLKVITINRPDSTGKHSLANVWGVSRLAQATGLRKVLLEREDIDNRYKELYVKYLKSINDTQGTLEAELPLPALVEIKSKDRQVLLIDDEADNGWGDVLAPIFKGNLTCISGKDKSFEEFYDEAKALVTKPIWDLILLDLRLDPKEDQAGNEYKMAKEYYGAKLLTYIKQQNAGNQVIMFTASNKAWNMQQLLDMKADGYYVKESPEFDQSTAFSVLTFNSFAERVNVCFEKNYLRHAWGLCESIKKLLRIVDTRLIRSPHGINLCLEQGFNSLYQATAMNQEFYLYSFLDFYRIIEVLGKELIRRDTTGFVIASKKGSTRFISLSPIIQSEITPTKNGKDIYSFDVGAYTPPETDKKFYQYPTSSTRFSGLMLLRFRMNKADTVAFLRLNKLRNDLTHEGNTTAKVAPTDILEILRLIERAFKEI